MSRRITTTTVAAAFAVLALAACDQPANSPGATGSPSPSATESPSASVTPAVTVSATATGTMRVPVYYLGGTTDRPVLYREFRSVEKSAGVVKAAVTAMFTLSPQDTDYRTVWPNGVTVLGVSTSGATATVDLSGNARGVRTDTKTEKASLQQLVHTVTAAAPAITAVRLLFDGAVKPTLWGNVDTTKALTRAAQENTLGPIWVIEPAHFAKVSRTFTVKGTATVFEATVNWAVTRPGSSTQLAHGFVTASDGAPARGDWTVKVTLPAGTTGEVVFTAWESSAEDGRVLHPDSKTYRVA